MKRLIVYMMFAGLFSLAACQEDAPVGHTKAEAMAGEWWVQYYVGGSEIGLGYTEIITSNTAANLSTEMLISDYPNPSQTEGNFWGYTVKAQVDINNRTFNASEVTSSAYWDGEPYPVKVNVLNGKIIPMGGHSKTGVATDSIYFELQFEDDSPSYGTTFIAAGHKRTGFQADDF